jgi:hypothetical protein
MPGPAGDQPAGHGRVRGFGHPHPTAATHGALDGVRALPAKGKNFSFRGCIRRPMGHPPGPTTCTPVRGAPPLCKKVVSSQRTTEAKARRSHSLPLLTYSAPGACGKTWVGPQNRRPDQESTKTWGHDVRVLSTDGGRGDGPLVGLAVRLRALGVEVRVCAPPDWSGGRQREMGTCRTRGSTLRETPVIRPASAGQRSTAASEVSR